MIGSLIYGLWWILFEAKPEQHFPLAIHSKMLQCEVFESHKTDISMIDWAMIGHSTNS